jgi:hypothetical protein
MAEPARLRQPPADGAPLLERYKIAVAEYRAEVSLGTERQRLFVTLNPAIAALASPAGRVVVLLALGLAALASLVGQLLVARSHARYRQTRHVLLDLARQLGCESDWQTTGGMREAQGDDRGEGVRVTTVIRFLLIAYALFDVVAIAALLWS